MAAEPRPYAEGQLMVGRPGGSTRDGTDKGRYWGRVCRHPPGQPGAPKLFVGGKNWGRAVRDFRGSPCAKLSYTNPVVKLWSPWWRQGREPRRERRAAESRARLGRRGAHATAPGKGPRTCWSVGSTAMVAGHGVSRMARRRTPLDPEPLKTLSRWTNARPVSAGHGRPATAAHTPHARPCSRPVPHGTQVTFVPHRVAWSVRAGNWGLCQANLWGSASRWRGFAWAVGRKTANFVVCCFTGDQVTAVGRACTARGALARRRPRRRAKLVQ